MGKQPLCQKGMSEKEAGSVREIMGRSTEKGGKKKQGFASQNYSDLGSCGVGAHARARNSYKDKFIISLKGNLLLLSIEHGLKVDDSAFLRGD